MSIPKKERFKKLNTDKSVDDLSKFSYLDKTFFFIGESSKKELLEEINKPNCRQIVLTDDKGFLYEAVIQETNNKILIVGIETIPNK